MMRSYQSRTTTKKSKASRRPRLEPIHRKASHELPADIQLTLLQPGFSNELRHNLLMGRLIKAVVEQCLIAGAETVAGSKHQGVEQAGLVQSRRFQGMK